MPKALEANTSGYTEYNSKVTFEEQPTGIPAEEASLGGLQVSPVDNAASKVVAHQPPPINDIRNTERSSDVTANNDVRPKLTNAKSTATLQDTARAEEVHDATIHEIPSCSISNTCDIVLQENSKDIFIHQQNFSKGTKIVVFLAILLAATIYTMFHLATSSLAVIIPLFFVASVISSLGGGCIVDTIDAYKELNGCINKEITCNLLKEMSAEVDKMPLDQSLLEQLDRNLKLAINNAIANLKVRTAVTDLITLLRRYHNTPKNNDFYQNVIDDTKASIKNNMKLILKNALAIESDTNSRVIEVNNSKRSATILTQAITNYCDNCKIERIVDVLGINNINY